MNEEYLQGFFDTYVKPKRPDANYNDWVSKISSNEEYKQGMFNTYVKPAKADATYEDWNGKIFGQKKTSSPDGLERNPAVTLAKKAFNTMRYQLPADMMGGNVAIQRLPFDASRKLFEMLPEGAQNFLLAGTGKKAGTPETDTFLNKAFKPTNQQKKQILQAYQLRNQGREADKGLIDTLDKVDDFVDLMNWTGAAIGNAGAQIPAAIITRGGTAYGQEMGTIYLDAINRIAEENRITPEEVIDRGMDEAVYPVLMGYAAGALEFAGAKGVVNSFGKDQVMNSLRDRALGLIKSVGGAGLKESLTEGGQSLLEQLGVSKSAGDSWTNALSKIDPNDIKESMAQGFVGGGGISAAGNAVTAISNKKSTIPERVQPDKQDVNIRVEPDKVRPEPNKQQSKVSLQPSETTEQGQNQEQNALVSQEEVINQNITENNDNGNRVLQNEPVLESEVSNEPQTSSMPPTAVEETAKEGGESKIQSWSDAFTKAKENNDLDAIENLYGKIKIALNGVVQGRIKDPVELEATIKEFESLKTEIEQYANEWKKSRQSVSEQTQQPATNPPAAQPGNPKTNTEVPGSEGVNREVGEVIDQVYYDRRKYGDQIYTWAYVKDSDGNTHQLGDPFPKNKPSNDELITEINRLLNTGVSFSKAAPVVGKKRKLSASIGSVLISRNEDGSINFDKSGEIFPGLKRGQYYIGGPDSIKGAKYSLNASPFDVEVMPLDQFEKLKSPAQSPKSAEGLPDLQSIYQSTPDQTAAKEVNLQQEKALSDAIDNALPDFNYLTEDELLNTSSPVNNKLKQKNIKKEQKQLKLLIQCLTK